MALQDELFKKVLPNGLTLLFQPMKHSASMAVGLFLKEGSLAESPEENGYFHFLEHMLFKDSLHRNAKEIATEIERVGGILNGSTSREYTQYYVVASKENARLAFDILSDMVFFPKFLEQDIKTEKEVVLEEMRSYEDAPDDFVYDFYFRNVFKGSPYARDIIGTRASIRGIKREKLIAFYKNHYTPDNMVLSVSGNLQWKTVIGLAEDYFEKFKKSTSKPKKPLVFPEPKKRFTKHLEKRKIEQFNLMLGAEGTPRTFSGVTSYQTLSTIFGGGMSSRLFQNIREKEGLCYSIYCFPTFYRSTGVFSISCATSKEKASKCVPLILKEVESLLKEGITAKELADAKTNQLGSMAIGSELPENRMNLMGLQEIYFGKYYTMQERIKAVKEVPMEEIRSIIQNIYGKGIYHLSCIGDLTDANFSRIPHSLQ